MKPVSSFFTPTIDWSQIQPQVSRWGKRSYSVQGFAGRVNLNQIVKIYKKQGESFDKAAVAREIRALNQRGKQKITEVAKTHRLCRIFYAIRSTFGNFFFPRKKILQQWEKNVFSSTPAPSPVALSPPPENSSPTLAALREKIDSFNPKSKYPKKIFTMRNKIPIDIFGIEGEGTTFDFIQTNRDICRNNLNKFLCESKEMRRTTETIAGENVKQTWDVWIQDLENIHQELQTSGDVDKNKFDEFLSSLNASRSNFSQELHNDDSASGEFAQFIEAASQFTVEAGNTPENRQFVATSIIQKMRDYWFNRATLTDEEATGSGTADAIFVRLEKFFPQNEHIIRYSIPQSEWVPITKFIFLLDKSHYVNMCLINGKEMYCDNLYSSPWFSRRDGMEIRTVSIRKEKLEEIGNIIDPQKLVIPKWERNNCWLSAAWVSFCVSYAYYRKLS